jgi:septal ring factor EnvC (AmiA/AmiB activator)
MPETPEPVQRLNAKLQLLIKKYQQAIKDTTRQSEQLAALNKELAAEKETTKHLQEQVHILKAATNTLSPTDKKRFEQHINQYIKEVEKCITYISD